MAPARSLGRDDFYVWHGGGNIANDIPLHSGLVVNGRDETLPCPGSCSAVLKVVCPQLDTRHLYIDAAAPLLMPPFQLLGYHRLLANFEETPPVLDRLTSVRGCPHTVVPTNRIEGDPNSVVDHAADDVIETTQPYGRPGAIVFAKTVTIALGMPKGRAAASPVSPSHGVAHRAADLT